MEDDLFVIQYHCRKCVYCAPTVEELRAHAKSHTDHVIKKCPQCSYTTQDPTDFKDHIIQHRIKRRCLDCKFRAKNMLELKNHRYNEHAYSCVECNFTSKTDALLRAHIKEKHFARIYVCTECDYTARNVNLYMQHIKQHYSPPNKFRCNNCTFITKSKAELEAHGKIHIIHKCPECIETFGDLYQLQVHVSIHNVVIKDYKCEVCGKEFATPSALKRHVIVHSTEKFKCPNCKFETKYKSAYDQHITKQKCNNKKTSKVDPTYKRKAKQRKLFQCVECGMSYLHDKELRIHLKKIHPCPIRNNLNSQYLDSNPTPPLSNKSEAIVYSLPLDEDQKSLYIDENNYE